LTDSDIAINESNGKVNAWLGKPEDIHIPFHYIMKHSQFGESIYSSPEGTCLSFDKYGDPVLDNESVDFMVNECIYRGVEKYFADVEYPSNSETADRIFGTLFSGNFSFDEAISKMTWSSYTANKGYLP
jgi:hypothetical protein